MAPAALAPSPAPVLPANGTTIGGGAEFSASLYQGIFVISACIVGILFSFWQYYQVSVLP